MLTRKSDNGTWTVANETHVLLDASPADAADGERRLMIAVLAQALRSLFRDAERPGRGALRRLRQDLRWLVSPDRSDLFAYERICEAVGIDAHRVRQRILGELGTVTELLNAPPSRRRGRAIEQPIIFSEPVRAVG